MRKAFRHDTDHDVSLVVEQDLFADDVWIAAEALLPKAVAEQSHRCGAGLIVCFGEIASEQRSRAHDGEISGADESRVEVFRLVGSGEVHGEAAKRRHGFEDLVARAPVEKVWIRKPA